MWCQQITVSPGPAPPGMERASSPAALGVRCLAWLRPRAWSVSKRSWCVGGGGGVELSRETAAESLLPRPVSSPCYSVAGDDTPRTPPCTALGPVQRRPRFVLVPYAPHEAAPIAPSVYRQGTEDQGAQATCLGSRSEEVAEPGLASRARGRSPSTPCGSRVGPRREERGRAREPAPLPVGLGLRLCEMGKKEGRPADPGAGRRIRSADL